MPKLAYGRVDVEQAYGNCPQYIQQRLLTPAGQAAGDGVRRGTVTAHDPHPRNPAITA